MYYIIAAVSGLLVLGGLGGYAWHLTRLVRQREQSRAAQQIALAQEAGQRRHQINRSIQLIAQGLLDEQMSLTEGAIRIRGLLDGLAVTDPIRDEFRAFYLLAQSTSHIPVLDAWKALKTKDKLIFDRQRLQLETDHREFVLDAAQRIRGREF